MRIFSNPGVLLLLAAAICGLTVAPAAADSCPLDCADGKVRLGIVAPTSGPPTAFGRQMVRPAEIAVRELNAAGGLLGVPVEAVVGDDRCEPGLAGQVARQQIESKIDAVIGPLCPAAAAAAAPLFSGAGIVEFLPAVSTIEVGRETPDKLFRMLATNEQEARALAAYLGREQHGKKLAVVYSDTVYRRDIVEALRAALPAEIKGSAQFEPLLDISGLYDRLADKLQRSQPDIIYLALDNAVVLELVDKLRQRGIKATIIGGQRLLSQDFVSAARERAGSIVILAPIDSLTSPAFRSAANLIRQGGLVPDLVALNSYAAVQTWAEAVRRAGSGDPRKVIEVLRSAEIPTAVGRVAFDQNGARRDLHFTPVRWQGGQLQPATLTQR
jgi:branched-chain amino acid transport system substrate-binding protein